MDSYDVLFDYMSIMMVIEQLLYIFCLFINEIIRYLQISLQYFIGKFNNFLKFITY